MPSRNLFSPSPRTRPWDNSCEYMSLVMQLVLPYDTSHARLSTETFASTPSVSTPDDIPCSEKIESAAVVIFHAQPQRQGNQKITLSAH